MKRTDIVAEARALYEDLDLECVKRWIAGAPGRKAVGYLPVYAPREIIHACGMLPVGVHGGGDQLEIIRGDAYYQSYICHLPRSVVELGLSGRLDCLSGMLFPSTCDVIRNLSGVWQVLKSGVYVRYLDLPQGQDIGAMSAFWASDLKILHQDLARLAGVSVDPEALKASIAIYNAVRETVRALYAARRDTPERVPSEELYLLCRAGEVLPPESFMALAEAYLDVVARDDVPARDNSRVVVIGAFCEQPPLGLIKTLERAGCYIVDDDFVLGNRIINHAVSLEGDPWLALSTSLVSDAMKSSIFYEADPTGKKRLVKERAAAARADGVIFAAASFCDPALLDRPMLRAGADAAHVPSISFKYSENSGQFQQFREQAGTFSDAIKLWGGR